MLVVNPLFQAKKSTFSTLPSCTNVGANCIKLFERIIIYYLRYIIAKIDEKNIYLSFCFLSPNKSKFYFPIVYICSTSKGTTFLPLLFLYFYLLDENVIFLPKNFSDCRNARVRSAIWRPLVCRIALSPPKLIKTLAKYKDLTLFFYIFAFEMSWFAVKRFGVGKNK